MSASRILLAISTSRYSQHLVDLAITEAERLGCDGAKVQIDVLYIQEEEDLARVGAKVGDSGFLGLATTSELLETLGAEHHRMALMRIEEVQAAATERGFAMTVQEVKGRFVEQVLVQAESSSYTTILITRADRPFISRILFGSKADRVARMAKKDGLGHVIIDELP
jgi:nucleotide-binding universal stress UspA family protein